MIGIRHAGRVMALSLVIVCATVVMVPAESAPASAKLCPECAQWNQPQKPFRIYGNTYYVGTQGLSAILITSDYGHVLIDGGLAESAPLIRTNIEALGFKIPDVKAILNSHPHFDHAGGIAALQAASGAQVFALRPADAVLQTGKLTPTDPQFGRKAPAIKPVPRAWVVQDDQLLGVASVRLRVIATPGHAPGGASWTWESCDAGKCLNFLYADSLAPVASNRFRFKDNPAVLKQFESSFTRLESTACDVLLTPHPDSSQLLQRLDPDSPSRVADIKDNTVCRRYVAAARDALSKRLAEEK